MIDLDIAELRSWFGFGVAGNFAGHLEQAGEAADFVNVAGRSRRHRAERDLPVVRAGLTTPSWASFRCPTTPSCCPPRVTGR